MSLQARVSPSVQDEVDLHPADRYSRRKSQPRITEEELSPLAQTSVKVEMSSRLLSRFLSLVGSWSLEEQKLWFPNHVGHDPDTWTDPHLLHLKREYDVLVKSHMPFTRIMYEIRMM